jgi:MFS family permease
LSPEKESARGRFSLPSPFNRLLLPVYIPSLIVSASQTALLILLPLYAIELGMSAALAALIVGARGIGLLVFDIPAGVLASRFGDRAILLIGLALMLVGLAVIALSMDGRVLAAGAFLSGAGFAAWTLGRQSYIADTCESHETGRAIAAMAGLQRVGILIGPAAGGVIAAATSYSLTFLVCAAVTIGAAALAAIYCGNPGSEEPASGLTFGPTVRVARDHARLFLTAGCVALSLQLMRGTRMLLIPLFGVSLGLDAATIGLIYSISAAIDMCLFYPVGVIVDRHGRKFSAIPSLILFALALLLLPLATSFWTLMAIGCLFGLANGLGTGIVMIIGADLSRKSENRSQFLGVWRLIGDLGMSGAPLLSAALVSVASLAAASVVAGLLGLVGAIVMLMLVPETLTRAKPQSPELP